jgi:FkbM family methyltransferase
VSTVRELKQLRSAFHNWRTLAIKGFLWKHLNLPRREIELQSRSGTTITAPLVRDVGALYTAVELFAMRVYEISWELDEEPFVVDIGANIGSAILWFAEQRPRLRGVCYEPDPAASTYLRANLRSNGLDDRIGVRDEAVSDRTGTAALFQAQPGAGVSSLVPNSSIVSFDRETEVPTIAFAEVIERVDGDVSLLKLDCEGAEYDIVERSPAAAWTRVKRVVAEYHPTALGRHTAFRKRLHEFGFAVVKEASHGGGLGTLWLERKPYG